MLFQFIPHGHCYLWKTNLVGLHLISDLLIAFSYYSIPLTLIYFVSKRKDLPYASIFLLFGAFIISCGTSHLMEIWTLWHPDYWLSGAIKAITALISLFTAIETFSVVPLALDLPSPTQCQLANQKLEAEVQERLKMATDLEKEKTFLQAMLDNLSDGIVACDENGVLALLNKSSREFFGMPQKPLSSEDWSEHYSLYYPDSKTQLKPEDTPLLRAFSGESFNDAELVTAPRQGKTRSLLANGSPIVDNDGVKIGAVVAVRDISQLQQAEKALRDSESILRSFYNSAPMMMGIVESDDHQHFRNISFNSATESFFNSNIAISNENQLAISAENRKKLNMAYLQSETSLEPVYFEFTESINQCQRHFAATVAKIVDHDLVGSSRFSYLIEDISDRKRMEHILQESEERFRLAFEDAATGMTLVAIDGHFLKANRSLCDILGFEEKELITLTFQKITHPDDLEVDLDYLHKLLAGEINSYQFEKRYIHKLGHTVWILLSVSLVRDIQDKPQYFIAQVQDISDRKEAEAKLSRSLQEKVVMLQEIHHRVKNNLQVICSLLNLQSRYLQEENTSKAFKETQNRVRSMALVHEQLYKSTNLSEVVLLDYIQQLTNNLFRAYNLSSRVVYRTEIEKFDLDLDTAVPCGLIINEVVSNSLKYAFKAQKQGEVLIRAFGDQNQSLVLIIEDNGCGLEPNFEIQTSKSLGLKLVKNLVQQLQGRFEITSEQNLGTKFTFTFDRIKQGNK